MMTDWLKPLLQAPIETLQVSSHGTKVELLIWGAPGLPGLFLLHGAGAHAHWWDGVAPLLSKTHRVAAMTLSGNGRSAWRDHYSSSDVFDDAMACVAASSLAVTGPPVFIGHSMGGAHLMHGAVHWPDAMRGLVLVDTSFRAPRRPPSPHKTTRRIFKSRSEALERFRLAPPGVAREPALVRHVARHALARSQKSGDGIGWRWRADPDYWVKFKPGIEQGPYPEPLHASLPIVHLVAEHSHVAAAANALPLDENVVTITLPDCGHHVMLDRPLLLAGALCTLLAVWP